MPGKLNEPMPGDTQLLSCSPGDLVAGSPSFCEDEDSEALRSCQLQIESWWWPQQDSVHTCLC